MFNKTICADFFTTINFNLFLNSLKSITIKLAKLRFWNDIITFENELMSYLWLNNSKIISFYNWRSALYHTLKIIWLKNKDEVIVNAYTCVSVTNAVIQSWAEIIYSDINNNNFWFDLDILEKNINKNTKVIIVQHTFWKNSNIKKIIQLAKKHDILIIEDCAQSLWTKIDWEHLWIFWDFAIFSTWRDKVISSVTWWFLIINNKKFFKKIIDIENILKFPSRLLTIRNLVYNIIAYKAYKTYDFLWLWKIIIHFSRKLWLITEILTPSEKKCNYNNFNLKLPNSLAKIAISELEKIKLYNNHRRLLAEYYDKSIKNEYIKIWFKKLKLEKNNYFRYPILIDDNKKIQNFYNYMRKNKILLWKSWSNSPIAPIWTDLDLCKFNNKYYPVAEKISKTIFFLPNHPLVKLEDAERIVKLINNYK